MPQEKITFYQAAMSGIVAGCAEVLVNHPLWVIKVRLQNNYLPIWALKGIYHGVFGNMISMVPLIALRISLSTTIQNQFANSNSPATELTSAQRIASGLIGGSLVATVSSPMEFMRTQQVGTKLTLPSVARNFVSKYGPRSLSVGMMGTGFRDALYTSGYIGLAPVFKEKLKPHCRSDLTAAAAAGLIAGAVAAFGSQPLDTLKIYQQQVFVKQNRNISTLEAAKEIIQKHGPEFFFRGATPRILRITSGVIIISNINEYMTNFFQKNTHKNETTAPKIK